MQEEFVGWTVIKECYVGTKWKMLRMCDDAGKPMLFTDYEAACDERGLLDVIAAETEVSYQALCNSIPVKIPKKRVLAGEYVPMRVSENTVRKSTKSRKSRRPIKGDTCVYLIRAEGLPQTYKIGQSINVDKRLITLQAASPVKLTVECVILAGEQLEYQLHKKFAEFRLHGEWFKLPDSAVAFIKALNDEKTSILL